MGKINETLANTVVPIMDNYIELRKLKDEANENGLEHEDLEISIEKQMQNLIDTLNSIGEDAKILFESKLKNRLNGLSDKRRYYPSENTDTYYKEIIDCIEKSKNRSR